MTVLTARPNFKVFVRCVCLFTISAYIHIHTSLCSTHHHRQPPAWSSSSSFFFAILADDDFRRLPRIRGILVRDDHFQEFLSRKSTFFYRARESSSSSIRYFCFCSCCCCCFYFGVFPFLLISCRRFRVVLFVSVVQFAWHNSIAKGERRMALKLSCDLAGIITREKLVLRWTTDG